MGLEIGLPYLLDQLWILTEGLTVGIPQVPCQGIFLSLPLWGWLPGMICFSFLLWRLVSFSPGRGHHSGGPTGAMGEVTGFLNLAVKGEVTIRGLGRDGLPINRWRGYISFTRVLLGQAWRWYDLFSCFIRSTMQKWCYM